MDALRHDSSDEDDDGNEDEDDKLVDSLASQETQKTQKNAAVPVNGFEEVAKEGVHAWSEAVRLLLQSLENLRDHFDGLVLAGLLLMLLVLLLSPESVVRSGVSCWPMVAFWM